MLHTVCAMMVLMTFVHANPELIITTTTGCFEGTYINTEVRAWLGLPYAMPPIGLLRYERPQPFQMPFGCNVYMTTTMPDSCIQNFYDFLGDFAGTQAYNPKNGLSENCLYLNIYAPRKQCDEPLPVMVWIHGGQHQFGSMNLEYYNPTTIVEQSNIIVVNIQYRLGAMGFLYLGPGKTAGGNMGLYDQVMAIQWIHQNIGYFGGDSSRITLAGQGSGGHSVALHIASSMTNKLFSRAIIQSSGMWPGWWDSDKQIILKRSLQLVKWTKCFSLLRYSIIKCLQSRLATSLVQLEEIVDDYHILYSPFGPIVDKEFVLDHPRNLIKKIYTGQWHHLKNDLQLLIGTNANEGYWPLMTVLPEIYPLRQLTEHEMCLPYPKYVKALQKVLYRHPMKDIISVANHYHNIDNSPTFYFNALAHVTANVYITADTELFAEMNAVAGNTVYRYLYNHQWSSSVWPKYAGVKHGDEIQFVFGFPLRAGQSFTKEEIAFSHTMMSYWTNFVTYGTPNRLGQTPIWPKYEKATQWQYMVLQPPHSFVQSRHLNDDSFYWNYDFPAPCPQE